MLVFLWSSKKTVSVNTLKIWKSPGKFNLYTCPPHRTDVKCKHGL